MLTIPVPEQHREFHRHLACLAMARLGLADSQYRGNTALALLLT